MKVNNKIRKDLNSSALRSLGYKLSILHGGYISADGATIIRQFQKPFIGQVELFDYEKETAHKVNVQHLREKGFLDE